ncbi:MAG: heavy metal translocating P-type ATPase [Acetatifactor sp.]
MKERFRVTGMTCSACSAHVEKAVGRLEGTEKVSVNLLTETMEVRYDGDRLDKERIMEAVEKAGYGAEVITDSRNGTAENVSGSRAEGERRRHRTDEAGESMGLRLGVSLGFLIPLMYVAMYHMYYEWFGLPIPGFVHSFFHGDENAMNFALTQFLLLLPILYMNRKYFSVGFKTLIHLSPNMDSLIALGSTAAVGYGIFALYRISYGLGHGNGEVVQRYSADLYFESAGMILTLITVGKYLEGRSRKKTGAAIAKLMDLSPKVAIVVDENGEEHEIPTENLQVGDIFLVKPGSLVPVDGIVLEGGSSVDEAAITGESIPVGKQPGDKVVSATMNKSGFLKCRADRVGEDTTLSQIIRLVEEAGSGKAPIARLADKVSGVFVPVVIGIALVTLCVWLAAGAGAEFAISSAIAVLVISCPCALGLATPVAIMVGTGVGASHGILIKSGEALQQARDIDTVVLDKTGTVTSGELCVNGSGCYVRELSPENLIQLAAALEKKSEHPLAEAITKEAARQQLPLPKVRDFQAVFGRGIKGVLAEDLEFTDAMKEDGPTAFFVAGRNRAGESASAFVSGGTVKAGTPILVGNQAFMEENGIAIDRTILEGLNQIAAEGMTVLLVAEEERLLGYISVSDRVKTGSAQAIDRFRKMGIRVVLLTGDNKRTAEAVRRQLGIEEAVAEVLPQDKEKKIAELKAQGRKVAMIGDGINDAPALAAADVGIAIGAGTDVAIESADIVLMKSDLRDAVTTVRLSRAVIRNIKQNLFWAFFYNAIGIPLAAGVWYPALGIRLNPMFGAAAMSLSSIFVVGNALRLRSFKTDFKKKRKRSAGEEIRPVEERKEKKMTKVITIEGMMCSHCTGRVQKALEALEGVVAVTMNLEQKSATLELSGEVSDEALSEAVTEAGYQVTSIHG